MKLNEAIKKISPLDDISIKMAKHRFSQIAMPLGSFGELQKAIIQLSGIQSKIIPDISKKAVLVFCADHGVVSQGVTQCGQEVTAVVTENINNGMTSVCIMADEIGADVIPIDIGVARDVSGEKIIRRKIRCGTADMTKSPAMHKKEAIEAIEVGIDIACKCKENGYNLLCTGEMGIGNTTASAAITAAMLGVSPEIVTGRGAGLSSEGLARKINAIKKALELHKPDSNVPIDVLYKVGGLEIAGMTGAYIGAAANKLPILADGVISCAAALCAVRICSNVRDYIIFSHISDEPASKLLLKELNAKPFICAGMRLGEGTGAVAGAALLQLALAPYKHMATFEQINIEAYKPLH